MYNLCVLSLSLFFPFIHGISPFSASFLLSPRAFSFSASFTLFPRAFYFLRELSPFSVAVMGKRTFKIFVTEKTNRRVLKYPPLSGKNLSSVTIFICQWPLNRLTEEIKSFNITLVLVVIFYNYVLKLDSNNVTFKNLSFFVKNKKVKKVNIPDSLL